MCGIIGKVGAGNVFPELLKGLDALEYRGYDSAGVAGIIDNKIIAIIEVNLRNKSFILVIPFLFLPCISIISYKKHSVNPHKFKIYIVFFKNLCYNISV